MTPVAGKRGPKRNTIMGRAQAVLAGIHHGRPRRPKTLTWYHENTA